MSPDPQSLPFNFVKYPWFAVAAGLPFCVWVICRIWRLWFKHFPGRRGDGVEIIRLHRRLARDPSHQDYAYARNTLRLCYLGFIAGLLSIAWHAWLFLSYAK